MEQLSGLDATFLYMAPLRAAVATASPDTELLEPGYLAATDVFA